MADYPAFARWQVYRILNKAKLTSRHPADPPVYSNEGAEGFEEGKEGSREGSRRTSRGWPQRKLAWRTCSG
jgi:hypothetical protein